MWTSTERLYPYPDSKVLKDGEPGKVSLLVGAGGQIPQDRARELGLLETEAKAAAPKANKAKTNAPENKAQ